MFSFFLQRQHMLQTTAILKKKPLWFPRKCRVRWQATGMSKCGINGCLCQTAHKYLTHLPPLALTQPFAFLYFNSLDVLEVRLTIMYFLLLSLGNWHSILDKNHLKIVSPVFKNCYGLYLAGQIFHLVRSCWGVLPFISFHIFFINQRVRKNLFYLCHFTKSLLS